MQIAKKLGITLKLFCCVHIKSGLLFCAILGSITSSVIALPQLSSSDEHWKEHEFLRFETAGHESLAAKDYSKAIDYFKQALTIKDEPDVAILVAKCYMRTDDWDNARRILTAVFKHRGYSKEFELLIECDLKLKLCEDALATCDVFQRECVLNDAVWLQRSKIHLLMGKRELAINCLKDGYNHCVRSGSDTDDIRYELNALHEPLPPSVPEVKVGNAEVLALLEYLTSLNDPVEEQITASNFDRITKRKLKFVSNGSVSDWRADDWSASTGAFQLQPDGMSFRVNPDLSYVTQSDLITSCISPSLSNAKNWTEKSQGQIIGAAKPEPCYMITLKNGELQLCFNAYAPEQLVSASRSFTPASVKEFARSDFDKTVQSVKRLNQLGKYEQATNYLLQHWQNRHIDLTEPDAAKKIATIKTLLIESLCWKPAVARYVEAAPYLAVSEDVLNLRYSGAPLPTIDEYKKHRWVARTVAGRQKDDKPYIPVNLEGYQVGCWLTPNMPLYQTVSAEIGDKKPMSSAVYIQPISGKLLDETLFQH